jgi:hypothetical protein
MDVAALAISVPCPQCQRTLPSHSAQDDGGSCPFCGAAVKLRVFPAAFAVYTLTSDSAPLGEEATCYFHADRVAVRHCARCGRFLCQLCRISWPGEDLCPACVEAALKEPETRHMESYRFHWDTLTLAVAVFPSLLISPSIISAPFALGLALFTFRKPCSILPRSKVRFVLAIAIALVEIAGWIFILTVAFRRAAAGGPS